VIPTLGISLRSDQLVNERKPTVFLSSVQVTVTLGQTRHTSHRLEVGATNEDLIIHHRESGGAMRCPAPGQDAINSPGVLYDVGAAQPQGGHLTRGQVQSWIPFRLPVV
jgi:hypothetical protein